MLSRLMEDCEEINSILKEIEGAFEELKEVRILDF